MSHGTLLVLLIVCSNPVRAQPDESGQNLFAPDLVELVTLDSTIRTDVRYATSNNFMGRKMYSQPRVFLQKPAAEAVVRVHRKLAGEGVGILAFDGYRPWSITKKFWDETVPEKRHFVANPAKGSKHNRGCAIDLSLYDLQTGEEILMPSAYDEFTERASPSYTGGTERQRQMRDLLRAAMKAEGFRVNPGEWWHFDYRDWAKYPVMDVSFEEIESVKNEK